VTRKLLVLPGALATALLAAGCGSSGLGPLGNGGNDGQQCVSQPTGKPVTMGLFNLQNFSKSATVTVKTVTLTDDHGLVMGKAWLVPILGTDEIGVTLSYPPGGRAWARRVPADGAVIRPGANPNLVFPVWRTQGRSGVADVTVTYSSGGTTYTQTEGISVRIAGNCFK
jgi:hypothetical protein